MNMRSFMLIILLSLMINASLCFGSEYTRIQNITRATATQNTNTPQVVSPEIGKNGETIATEEEEPISLPKREKPTSERDKPGTTPGPKRAPLRGFVPSERIPADQAVDFPADI